MKARMPLVERLPALLAIAFVLVAVGIFTAGKLAHREPPSYAGTLVDPPKTAANATLEDQDGKRSALLVPGARLEYLFFGYTHCPDECPLALGSLARAVRIVPASVAADVRVVFVTVDPAHDTPAVLRRYVRGFDPHFIGLTGTRAELARVWNAYGVAVDASTKELVHGDAIYAIDASHDVVLVYEPSAGPKALASDARLLLER